MEEEQIVRLSPLSKVIIGALIIVVLWFVFPMIDLIEAFTLMFFIPLLFFVAIEIMSEGTYEMIRQKTAGAFFKSLKERIDTWSQQFKSEDTDTIVVEAEEL